MPKGDPGKGLSRRQGMRGDGIGHGADGIDLTLDAVVEGINELDGVGVIGSSKPLLFVILRVQVDSYGNQRGSCQ